MMKRSCPHCGVKMDVFDEECPLCGKASKPGALLGIAAVLYGHRSWFLLIGILTLSWIILSKLFKF